MHGGTECSPLTETTDCNTHSCCKESGTCTSSDPEICSGYSCCFAISSDYTRILSGSGEVVLGSSYDYRGYPCVDDNCKYKSKGSTPSDNPQFIYKRNGDNCIKYERKCPGNNRWANGYYVETLSDECQKPADSTCTMWPDPNVPPEWENVGDSTSCSNGVCIGGECVEVQKPACTPIPKETACSGIRCGTALDGCEGEYECGTCGRSSKCKEGVCKVKDGYYCTRGTDCYSELCVRGWGGGQCRSSCSFQYYGKACSYDTTAYYATGKKCSGEECL